MHVHHSDQIVKVEFVLDIEIGCYPIFFTVVGRA